MKNSRQKAKFLWDMTQQSGGVSAGNFAHAPKGNFWKEGAWRSVLAVAEGGKVCVFCEENTCRIVMACVTGSFFVICLVKKAWDFEKKPSGVRFCGGGGRSK